MATSFADRLKFLQAQTDLGLKRAGAESKREGSLASTISQAGKDLDGPAGALLKGFGAGQSIRGAFDKRGKVSKEEELLGQMETQLGQLRGAQIEAEKRAKVQKDLQKVALPSLQTLAKMQSGQVSQEEGINLLTSNARSIYGDAATVSVDPRTSLVTVDDGKGNVFQTYPNQLAGLTGRTAEEQSLLMNEFTSIATTKGELAGAEKVAEAQAVTSGISGTQNDTRIGLGLERPIERTQEIPVSSAEINDLAARSGGRITNPAELAVQNERFAPRFDRILTEADGTARIASTNINDLGRARDIITRAINSGKSVSGLGDGLAQNFQRAADSLGLDVDEAQLKDRGELEALGTQLGITALQGFKGPTTDFEFKQAMRTVANSSRTEAENKRILDVAFGIREKQMLEPGFIEDYTRGQPALIGDATRRFNDFMAQVPSTASNKVELLEMYMDPSFKPSINSTGEVRIPVKRTTGNATGDLTTLSDDDLLNSL